MEKNQFGELVRRAREAKGLKAFELADLMRTHGSAISRLENGTFKETPSVDLMNQLHEHLGLTHREMLMALGYAVGEPAPKSERPDAAIVAQLCAAAEAVPDWDKAANVARGLIWTMQGVRYDQTPHAPGEPTLAPPLANSGRAR